MGKTGTSNLIIIVLCVVILGTGYWLLTTFTGFSAARYTTQVVGLFHSAKFWGAVGILLLISLIPVGIRTLSAWSAKKSDRAPIVTSDGRAVTERINRGAEILEECPYVTMEQTASTLRYMSEKSEPDAIDMVDFLLVQAIGQRASDIHWEPGAEEVIVKFRIDGVMHALTTLPRKVHPRVVSRLRVMSNLAIYKRDVPQDGRLQTKIRGQTYELRLSILPTLHAEKCVIRLFNTAELSFRLELLGMPPDTLEKFREVIAQPQGTIFLTGPTGSGKTTTIYSALREIQSQRHQSVNIVTIEDPIEHEIAGFNQTGVNLDRGLTFSVGLRTILRQDPDVIMVGEIRDIETAQIAIRAGLTGHLVFTTLHADSAVGVFNRLIEMGTEPFLLMSSSSAVVAQRLVRILCSECKKRSIPPLSQLKRAHLAPDENIEFFTATGCSACSGIGFKGRTGIYEFLILDDVLREVIIKKVSSREISRIATERGMRPLLEDGLIKVRQGQTSLEEVLRVCM